MSPPLWPESPAHWHNAELVSGIEKPRLYQALALIPVLGILLGGILLVFGALRPMYHTLLVPLWLADAANEGLPPLVWATQDREALLALDWRTLPATCPERPDRGATLAALRALRHGAAGQRLMVYLAAPACQDGQGQVQLLPRGAQLGDTDSWLPLRQVLEELRGVPARYKLLILDVAWATDSPAVALLSADAPARIHETLDAVPDPTRLVLLSAGPGQVSHASEVLGRTLFNYYLEQGLRGAADGVGGTADGQVTVRELAAYVSDRVRCTARHAFLARQEPQLLGPAIDFPLRMLPREAQAAASNAGLRVYPPWLRDAWQKLPVEATPESFAAARTLLAAERAWRAGESPARLKTPTLQALKPSPTPNAAQQPPVFSLARAGAGKPVDAALLVCLNQFQAELELRTRGQTPDQARQTRETLKTALLKNLKDRPLVELLRAVVEQAYRLTDPRPENLEPLVELLQTLEPEPGFVETLSLRTLAAAAEAGLSRTTLRQALEVLEIGERVAARPRSSAWVHRRREQAARTRHLAEVLLVTPGYTTHPEIHRALEDGLRAYREIVGAQDAVEQALATLDRSRCWLGAVMPMLARSSLLSNEWQRAMQAALTLHQRLADARRSETPAATDLPPLTAAVSDSLEQLLYPLESADVERLLRDARGDGATASTWRMLDALLTLPAPTGPARIAIWEALRDLEIRLLAEAERMPVRGPADAQMSSTPSRVFPNAPSDPLLRAQQQLQLLRLADTDAQALADLEQRLAMARDPAARLAAARRLWQSRSAVAQPVCVDGEADLRAWLADWYRYEAREQMADSPAARFYARAAEGYRPWLRTRDAYVVLRQEALPSAAPAGPTATVRFVAQAVPSDPAPADVEVTVLPPDGARLETQPARWALERAALSAGPCARSCRVHLASDAADAATPRGLLLLARLEGRLFHTWLDLPFRPAAPEILFRPAGTVAQSFVGELHLRPVRGTQSFALWLRNPGPHAWPRLSVEILAGAQGLATSTVALAPRETRPITFAVPPPSPKDLPPAAQATKPAEAETPLPAFTPPLAVRLRDLDHPDTELGRRTVPVLVDAARDYVRLERTAITAAGAPGRSTVRVDVVLRLYRAAGDISSTAQLCVPDADGPAPSVRDGTLQGTLATSGDPLRLYVENMTLPRDDATRLSFAVRVDDWQRAFLLRAPLAQPGVPAVLQVDEQPAVRLVVPRWGRADKAFRVPVEVAHAPAASTLEVSIGRLDRGDFVAEGDAWRGPPWQTRIGCRVPGRDGGMDFTAAIEGPDVTLNTSDVRGPREVRARLLDAQGTELAFDGRSIVLSDAPPAAPRFLDPPPRAWRATPLRLRASGGDPVTKIRGVTFFVGEPVDGKLPPGALSGTGRPVNDEHTVWEGDLPLPPKHLGPTPISVQFVNELGLSRFDTIRVTLEEKDPLASRPGRIQGVVREGTRPQAGLNVVLSDEKGASQAKASTNEQGQFVFRDVAPGKYRLSCDKSSTQRRGTFPTDPQQFLDVAPGATVAADLLLFIP
jgi:hypothetical protein